MKDTMFAYPAPELPPRLDGAAKHAVGESLLFRISTSGGSSGDGIDEHRAADIAAEGINGEDLYELLIDVARRATEDAEREVYWMKQRLLEGAAAVAEKSDSLTMHRFVEELSADVKQRDDQRRNARRQR